MAEEIRLNSRDYPRPVPIEMFEAPPFALPSETIREALAAMAADSDYADITSTATRSGAIHLFATRSLERHSATFMAEHAERPV